MTVRELIEKLQKCDPNATVCVEAWSDPEIKEVKEYTDNEFSYVYIGDDLENVTYELTEEDNFKEVN